MITKISPAWRHPDAERGDDRRCTCPHVDIGVGMMQTGLEPGCPTCDPLHDSETWCVCADAPRLRPGDEVHPGCPIHGE